MTLYLMFRATGRSVLRSMFYVLLSTPAPTGVWR